MSRLADWIQRVPTTVFIGWWNLSC